MTTLAHTKNAVIRQLNGALTADLPRKAAYRGQALLDRLNASVRLGLFGLPNTGKRALLNALASEDIVDPTQPLPTLELVHGPWPRTQVMLPDGTSLGANGYPGADLAEVDPVYVQVQTPSERLLGCDILLLATDPTPEDMRAGLEWAAARVDLSIWCTRDWSAVEQEVWQTAPDVLRNHAILMVTDNVIGDVSRARPDFERVLAPHTGQSLSARMSLLSSHVQGIIDEATTQDLHAAEMFLHKYAPVSTAFVKQRAEIITMPAARSRPLTRTALAPDTRAALARLFHCLRQDANALRRMLDEADAQTMFMALADRLEALSERALSETALDEAAPDISALIEEARDLALLMRIEADTKQLEDAAMLLVQLRRAMETRLAA